MAQQPVHAQHQLILMKFVPPAHNGPVKVRNLPLRVQTFPIREDLARLVHTRRVACASAQRDIMYDAQRKAAERHEPEAEAPGTWRSERARTHRIMLLLAVTASLAALSGLASAQSGPNRETPPALLQAQPRRNQTWRTRVRRRQSSSATISSTGSARIPSSAQRSRRALTRP